MLDTGVKPHGARATMPGTDVIAAVRAAAAGALPALVHKIDAEGYYPESVLREFGRLGAFARHLPDRDGGTDLVTAIDAMAVAAEYCLSTSFCMWCQDALAWYIYASGNEALKTSVGAFLPTDWTMKKNEIQNAP